MTDNAEPRGFDQFELSPELLEGIAGMGYMTPTAVQVAAIPPGLAGSDMVVESRTGTGKTAAFGIPILERIDLSRDEPQALVLCPTRELALQVEADVARLGRPRGVRSVTIYGGASMGFQIDALRRGVHFVVGTPGRILDHLRQRTLRFRAIRFLVLDEADEMLSMGFYEEVSAILSQVPRERQTMLFSATLASGVEGLIYHHQSNPVRIGLSSDTHLVREISHYYFVTPTMEKARNLVRILEVDEPRSAIIFCNTRDEVRVITGYLKRAGVSVEMISGELTQAQRERVMTAIKSGELRLMVATDVAARGIDIEDLSHVINYSVPETAGAYVHRTGRTGRIGKTGTALTLVGLKDLPRFSCVEGIKGIRIEQRKLPSEEEVLEKRVDKIIADVRHLKPLDPGAVDATGLPSTPQSAFDEKAFLVAAQRLLDQGLEAPVLASVLRQALASEPPAPLPVLVEEPEAEPRRRPEGTGDESPQRRRKRRRRRRPPGEGTGPAPAPAGSE